MTETPIDRWKRGLRNAIDSISEWAEHGSDYDYPPQIADGLGHIKRIENGESDRLGDRYYTLRSTSREGRVVAGLVYARNLVEHDSAQVDELVGRRPFRVGRSTLLGGDTLLGTGVVPTWRPFAELPPPGEPESHGRDRAYAARVEGRAVTDTFEDALLFFESLP